MFLLDNEGTLVKDVVCFDTTQIDAHLLSSIIPVEKSNPKVCVNPKMLCRRCNAMYCDVLRL